MSITFGGCQRRSRFITIDEEYEDEFCQYNSSSNFSWQGAYHLDINLFKSCLEIHGPEIFIDLIIEV